MRGLMGSGSGSGSGMGEDGDDDGSLWWLGVLMSICASIASNLGVNVQKFSMMKEAVRVGIRGGKPRAYVAQPIWLLGLLLVIGGSLGDFAALGFAAQSLITPVGGFTMVANVVFAHFWLGEHLSRSDLVGTALVIVGVVLIAAFADKAESSYTLSQLIDLYGEVSFLIYAAFVLTATLVLYCLVKYIERMHRTLGPNSSRYAKWRPVHQFIYPTLSGVLGAQSVLFAKSTAELIKSAFRGGSPFSEIMTWVILVCMLSTIFMQLHWLAVALQWFDAVYCIPVFQCFFIIVTIFGGALYFQELSRFSVLQAFMFPLGVLVTLTGIILLSQRTPPNVALKRFRVAGRAVHFMVRTRRVVRQRKRGLAAVDEAAEGEAAPHMPMPGLIDLEAEDPGAGTSMSDPPANGGVAPKQFHAHAGSMATDRDAKQDGSPSCTSGARAAVLGKPKASRPPLPGRGRGTGAASMAGRGSGPAPHLPAQGRTLRSAATQPSSTMRAAAGLPPLRHVATAAPSSSFFNRMRSSSADTPGGGMARSRSAMQLQLVNDAQESPSILAQPSETHAPLPMGVALAEGLATVASLVLPHSVSQLIHLGPSQRNIVTGVGRGRQNRRSSAPDFSATRVAFVEGAAHSTVRPTTGTTRHIRGTRTPHSEPGPARSQQSFAAVQSPASGASGGAGGDAHDARDAVTPVQLGPVAGAEHGVGSPLHTAQSASTAASGMDSGFSASLPGDEPDSGAGVGAGAGYSADARVTVSSAGADRRLGAPGPAEGPLGTVPVSVGSDTAAAPAADTVLGGRRDAAGASEGVSTAAADPLSVPAHLRAASDGVVLARLRPHAQSVA